MGIFAVALCFLFWTCQSAQSSGVPEYHKIRVQFVEVRMLNANDCDETLVGNEKPIDVWVTLTQDLRQLLDTLANTTGTGYRFLSLVRCDADGFNHPRMGQTFNLSNCGFEVDHEILEFRKLSRNRPDWTALMTSDHLPKLPLFTISVTPLQTNRWVD